MKSQVAGEDRISSSLAGSVLGLRKATTQASRNQVENKGKEGLLHITESKSGEILSAGHHGVKNICELKGSLVNMEEKST